MTCQCDIFYYYCTMSFTTYSHFISFNFNNSLLESNFDCNSVLWHLKFPLTWYLILSLYDMLSYWLSLTIFPFYIDPNSFICHLRAPQCHFRSSIVSSSCTSWQVLPHVSVSHVSLALACKSSVVFFELIYLFLLFS